MSLHYIRKAILVVATAAFILAGCSSPRKYDDSNHLATKPAAGYSTQAKIETQTIQTETKNQSQQVAAPTVAMTKHCLGGRQPLLTLDSLDSRIMIDETKTALPYSFYDSAQFNLSSGALGYERQLVFTPTEGMSLYFTSVNSGEGSGKSEARKLATQELLKQIKFDKISVMLPRDLSLYNKLNINAGIRFGAPNIRDLVQALAGNKGHEKWNDVLSGFKLGGYINYGNFSIGVGIMPRYNAVEDRIKLDAPVMAEYGIRF